MVPAVHRRGEAADAALRTCGRSGALHGEPVAVVVARDRYGAEDALERIEVEYRELDPVVDPVAAAAPGAPLLHRDVGSNVVSDRRLRYGDPDAAFASAAHRVAISVRYPRNGLHPDRGIRRPRRAPR